MRPRAALFVLACAVAPALAPTDADACINVTRAEVDRHVRVVQGAEAALTAENPARARAILDGLPHVTHIMAFGAKVLAYEMTDVDVARDQGLVQRMRRIYSLAIVRTVPRRTAPGLAQPPDLATAEEMITRALDDAKVGGKTPEPSLIADYAEVMASTGHDDVAAPLLRWLAVGDLMGNAHAYAQLARIEAAAGNAEAAAQARDRCKQMAKQPAICPR